MPKRHLPPYIWGATSLVALALAATPAFAQVKLTLATWDGPDGQAPIQKIIDQYEKLHPDVQITIEPVGSDYDARIVAGIATGNLPDIFLWWNFPELTKKNVLTDLTPILQSGSIGATEDTWYRPVLAMSTVGSKVFGLPKDFTPRVIFFNKDLFAQSGLPAPTDDWSWDTFRTDAKKLTVPNQRWGFAPQETDYPLQGWVWSNGGDFLGADGATAEGTTDSPATLEAVQWLANLKLADQVSPPPGLSGDLFELGKVGMSDNGRWPMLQYLADKGLNFGTVVPPRPNGHSLKTIIHASAWVVAKSTPHPQEALKFLAYLSGPAGARAQAASGWALPAVPGIADELGINTDPLQGPFIQALQYATVTPDFMRNNNWSELEKPLADALAQIFSGKQSAKTALASAATQMQGILDSKGGAING